MNEEQAPHADAILLQHRTTIGRVLATVCDNYLVDVPNPVADAIRYSLMGEGKRMRGILFLSAFEAAGGAGDAGLLGASIEVVHAYSLVHDDLPCMDDDDMRRGRATAHKVFGVAGATAAGMAMVPLAARCAAEGAALLGLSGRVRAGIVAELMRAAGAGGMIGGQLLDLEGEGRALTLSELEQIHRAKTGALIAGGGLRWRRQISVTPCADTAKQSGWRSRSRTTSSTSPAPPTSSERPLAGTPTSGRAHIRRYWASRERGAARSTSSTTPAGHSNRWAC